MADDLERPGEDAEHEVPPHAAPPSIWPFAFALGIAVALIGLVISWPVAAIGGAIALVFGFLWIRDATHKTEAEGGRPWPERIEMSAEIRDLVDRRWGEYGIERDDAGNGRISKDLRRKLRL